jgi:hypothetical protein
MNFCSWLGVNISAGSGSSHLLAIPCRASLLFGTTAFGRFPATSAPYKSNFALRQIPVANNPPPARLIRQIRVHLDESRHLHFNRLRQKTPRAKAQNLRQWIL